MPLQRKTCHSLSIIQSIIEEYIGKDWRKCKKDDAVKVVKKGTVLQKGVTRYFTDKNDFFFKSFFVKILKFYVAHNATSKLSSNFKQKSSAFCDTKAI